MPRVSQLPPLDGLGPESREKCGRLRGALAQWHANGATAAFTLADLVLHAQVPAQCLRDLLGQQWQVFFAEAPPDDTIIPLQCVLLLVEALARECGAVLANEEDDFTQFVTAFGKRLRR